MRTATMLDLQTRLPTILAWLEAGEEVVVKPKLVEASPKPFESKVDWSQSTGFRDRTGETVLTTEDLTELYEEMRGSY